MQAHNAAPQVSVIVRSMARPSLDDALGSLARQRDVDAEVVVVAACGPGHPAIGERAAPHRVRLVAGERPLQRAAAANAGLAACEGEWITFLDDDDRFEPDHLAGLLAGARQAPKARVVTSYAKSVLRDGPTEYVGQPFALAELYERNFVHLSACLFARELVDAGCRFDESLEILEDWDFVLQLAHRALVHFVPLASFQWNADAGDSGAGRGANYDEARLSMFRERVYAKWASEQQSLARRTRALLERAIVAARSGRVAEADALCLQALDVSVNDPWALNVRAMVLRQAGRLADARCVQTQAVAVRPMDAGFVHNLALLDRAAGDREAAKRNAQRAITLEPACQPAQALIRELDASASHDR